MRTGIQEKTGTQGRIGTKERTETQERTETPEDQEKTEGMSEEKTGEKIAEITKTLAETHSPESQDTKGEKGTKEKTAWKEDTTMTATTEGSTKTVPLHQYRQGIKDRKDLSKR